MMHAISNKAGNAQIEHEPRSEIRNRLHLLENVHCEDDLRLECGTAADYHRLSPFHYRGRHPGAITQVWRYAFRRPTVVGRFTQRREESELAGVLVLSLPALSCALRNFATANRYAGLDQRAAALMLNREVRTISRVVIDPRWRACGLAVRLVRHALAHPESERIHFTEALAVMGRINPFFERAGMIRYERPRHATDARLLDAFDALNISPALLASPKLIEARLAGQGVDAREFLMRELHRWRRTSSRSRRPSDSNDDLPTLIRAARDQLIAHPVYYLYHHDLRTRLNGHADERR